MSERNLALAQLLLEKMSTQAPVEEFEDLVSDKVVVEFAGDAAALPWIGPPKTGRQAFTDFIRAQRELVDAETFRVDDILHNETKAVILGALSATLKRTAKPIRTDFALILTIADGKIARFHMLEDSYAVSQAAR